MKEVLGKRSRVCYLSYVCLVCLCWGKVHCLVRHLLISFSDTRIWSPMECAFLKSSLAPLYRFKRNVTVLH